MHTHHAPELCQANITRSIKSNRNNSLSYSHFTKNNGAGTVACGLVFCSHAEGVFADLSPAWMLIVRRPIEASDAAPDLHEEAVYLMQRRVVDAVIINDHSRLAAVSDQIARFARNPPT